MTDSDMLCEKHPDSVWPHDTCLGPGIPHPIIQRERATIADLQAQLAAAQGDTELAERIARQNAALVDTATERINELETELSEATAYGAALAFLFVGGHLCPTETHEKWCMLSDPPAAVKTLLEERERDRRLREGVEWELHGSNFNPKQLSLLERLLSGEGESDD